MKANLNSRWDWPAAILLIVMVFTAAARLITTNWTPDLSYVGLLTVIGSVLGLTLGYSRFKRAALFGFVSGYSLVIIPLQLSRMITGENTAIGQLASLGGRFTASLVFLFSGKAIEDPLFFVTLMAILFWAIGIYSGYRLVRYPAVLAVMLPSTLPIMVIQYYDSYKAERIWGLALYFFVALLLTGRMNMLNARQRWQEQNIAAGSTPEFDLNKYIVIASAVIILMAWTLPAPATILPAAAGVWKNLNQPFEGVRQRINDMLAALHGGSNPNTASELYGSTMDLGRTVGSGTNELFNVHVPQNNLPRLYWRLRIYSIYQDGNWQAASSETTIFNPGQGSIVRNDIMQSPTGEFTFTWQADRSRLLATPSLPVWVSRTGTFQTPIKKEAGIIDPLSWNVSPDIQTGDQYKVLALLLSPSRKELRNASDEYPQWIKDQYLQIPESISADFAKLASQITNGKATTFDKADAITEYLRQNISYSETIPSPPPGVDPLSWFILVWKSGFCNYYASADVLLLRSQGIPARMVVGYSQGKSGDFGTYSVRGMDAHAWPEVYFPGIGWVEFEPTVTQDALIRPDGDDVAQEPSQQHTLGGGINGVERTGHEPVDPEGISSANANTFLGFGLGTWLWIIVFMVFITSAVFWGWKLHKRQSFNRRLPLAVKAIYNHYHLKSSPWLENWLRWGEVSSVERAFHSINQSLAWLNKPQPIHATPTERAQLLKDLVPDASQEIDRLITVLEQTVFGSHPESSDTTSALRMGWKIRFFTLRAILLSRFYK